MTPSEIEAIRERHEAEIREPNKWTFNRAEAAHADRATLLRLLSEERARRVEVEGALAPFAKFERAIRNSYAEWSDDRDFYRYNDTPILLGDLRRATSATHKDTQ